jgi:hypothetical protein
MLQPSLCDSLEPVGAVVLHYKSEQNATRCVEMMERARNTQGQEENVAGRELR